MNGTVARRLITAQQRDRDQIILVPMRIRSIVPTSHRIVAHCSMSPEIASSVSLGCSRGVFLSLVTHLQRAHVVYSGTDPCLRRENSVVGLQAARIGDTVRPVALWTSERSDSDGFEITKQFGREARPPVTTLRHTVHAEITVTLAAHERHHRTTRPR